MTRIARCVTVASLVAATMIALPAAAGADTGSGSDASSHAYGFDHTLADGDGGPAAVAHGPVVFAPGRDDPPVATDGAVRFGGRASDYLSLPAPVLDYPADFTLDLWISTADPREQTVIDTRSRCDADGRGWAVVLHAGRVVLEGAGDELTAGDDDDHRSVGRRAADDDHPPGPRVDDGHWHEITLSRTGGVFVLSVDGQAAGTTTGVADADPPGTTTGVADADPPGPTPRGADADPALLGGARLGGGRCGDADPFHGDLDDLTTSLDPPAALPEVPVAVLLPLSAGLAGGAVLLRRSRRRHRRHRRSR